MPVVRRIQYCQTSQCCWRHYNTIRYDSRFKRGLESRVFSFI